jgi:hypothetical protein
MLTINWVRVRVFNATFNNISVTSWQSVLLVEKTTNLLRVTDKLYHIMLQPEVKMTLALLQTTGGKDEPNIVYILG